jgi:chromosome transmission fidelity protein 4
MIYSTSIKKVILRQTAESIPICMAFSPSENLLAWTCLDGSLVRLQSAIPTEFHGPNQKTSERKSTASAPRDANDPLDENDVAMDYDDDWVIDDLGDAFKDKPAREANGQYTKEMGMHLRFV